MKFDYKKHFKEDALAIERELAHPASQWSDQDISLPYKTRRCINKYAMAKKCHRLTPQNFLEDEQYKGMDIWDLDYISSSDEEDFDKDSEEEEPDEESQEEDGPVIEF